MNSPKSWTMYIFHCSGQWTASSSSPGSFFSWRKAFWLRSGAQGTHYRQGGQQVEVADKVRDWGVDQLEIYEQHEAFVNGWAPGLIMAGPNPAIEVRSITIAMP